MSQSIAMARPSLSARSEKSVKFVIIQFYIKKNITLRARQDTLSLTCFKIIINFDIVCIGIGDMNATSSDELQYRTFRHSNRDYRFWC